MLTAERRTAFLIREWLENPAETPWLEFKENNRDAAMIGRLISALSNAACLHDKSSAYVLWGIRDADHAVIGTDFDPATATCKNQPLEHWLSQHLHPKADFRFQRVEYQGKSLLLLKIPAASHTPVAFDQTAYIHIGSATSRLADCPEHQRTLWAKLQSHVWESGVAESFLDGDTVLDRLDYAAYFSLTGQRLPDNRAGIFAKMQADGLIDEDVGGHWKITNLGAILFARRLADFPSALARKAVRFVMYAGTITHRRDEWQEPGYVTGFAVLINHIDNLMPRNEHIGKVFREALPLYPRIAIRELVANALIHQDMTISGAGPLLELFADRLEITNPGKPLVQPDRFLDYPPCSRNEALAALMRRMRICEEQGTGIDKTLTAIEMHQLPPPDFRVEGDAVRVTLFAPRRFADMSPQERVRACYQHAALCYVSGKKMTNASLRERLGIAAQNAAQNAAQASSVIKAALREK